MLLHVSMDSLAARRVDLSQRFFRDIMDPASCLHSLLPPPRSTASYSISSMNMYVGLFGYSAAVSHIFMFFRVFFVFY